MKGEQGEHREIIDVHCHCFTGLGQTGNVARGLAMLRQEGLSLMAVMGLVNTRFDDRRMWNLVPDFVENFGDRQFYEADDLLELKRRTGRVLFPMVDTRHLVEDVTTHLRTFIERGFQGIKGIYLAESDNDLKVGSIPETFGISREEYHRREWEIFAFAEANDLPLLYHIDTRRHADFVRAMLADFPRLRIDLPHFGISRRACCGLLDRFPNVYTDLASMLPYIRQDPAGYSDFICHYRQQVCFGSDAFLYQPEVVLEYIRLVRSLDLPVEVEINLFSANPRSFLGLPQSSELFPTN